MTTKIKTKATHPKSKTALTTPANEETTMTLKITPKSKKTIAHATNEETTVNATPETTDTPAQSPPQETTVTTKPENTTTHAEATNAPAPSATNAHITTEPTMTTTNATTTAPISTSLSVGLAALVTELSAALDDAEERLGPKAPAITAAEKKRTAKPRKGSDKVLLEVAPIVDQFKLNSSSLNTTQMIAQYKIAQTLLPLQARLQKLSKRVDDEVFGAQTDSWEMGLQLYSMLQRRAKSDGAIADAIAPLVKLFSYRHPTVQKTTKETTRVNAQLKKTLAVAQKHGVSVTVAPDGSVQVIKGTPAAVAAAQAELGTQGTLATTSASSSPSAEGDSPAATVTGSASGAPASPSATVPPATPAVAPAAPVAAGH